MKTDEFLKLDPANPYRVSSCGADDGPGRWDVYDRRNGKSMVGYGNAFWSEAAAVRCAEKCWEAEQRR
jgi:hypothetical protein